MKKTYPLALSVIVALGLAACSGPVKSASRDAIWMAPNNPARIVRVTSNLAGNVIPRQFDQANSRKFQQINIMLQVKEFKATPLSIDHLANEDCSIALEVDTTIVGCRGAKLAIPDLAPGSADTNLIMDTLNMTMKQTAG